MRIEDVLGSIEVLEPVCSGGLQVFPLMMPSDLEAGYVLLEDLLERKLAEITEVGERGSVPDLVVINDSDSDALILDGTELHGAKQDRMVNITLIIAKRSRETIPVSCVEAGRWAYRSRSFRSSGRTVASRLRKSKYWSVYSSLAASGHARSDQAKIWDEISAYQERAGAHSGTDALADAFEQKTEEIERIVAGLKDVDAHGALVALNGRIEGMDLITHRATFRKAWSGLLHGYAMDAVLEKESEPSMVGREAAREWVEAAGKSVELIPQEVPGTGECFSLRGSGVSGGVVCHRGEVVHVMVFPGDAGHSRDGHAGN